jgi:hypothetical protein
MKITLKIVSLLTALLFTGSLAFAQAPAPDSSAGVVVHLVGNSGTPTVALNTAGAGSGSSVAAFAGTDLAGTVSITTAGSPGTSAVVATITFANPYGATPHVLMTPGNAAAAHLAVDAIPVVTVSTTEITITSGTTALGTTTYIFNYMVAE